MEKTRLFGCLLILFATSLCYSAIAAPRLAGIKPDASGNAVIQGSGLGSQCRHCELIADFGRGFKYAFPIRSWSDTRVVAQISDLNKGPEAKITLHTAHGSSNTLRYKIPTTLQPARRLGKPVRANATLQLFEHQSTLKVGDKGEEHFNVSTAPPRCGKTGLVYDSADLVYQQNRFGEAQIVATPKPGCTRCQPLKVRWYHEPTGKLHFQVQVYRRVVTGICADRVRR